MTATEIVAIASTLLLIVTVLVVVVGLIWLRFFSCRPCHKIRKVVDHPNGVTQVITTDGTSYWSRRNQEG